MDSDGASNNERLLAAAKSDNEDLLLEVFSNEGTFDINYKDSLGNTALHYAAAYGSTDVLEHILTHDDCDVDPVNRLERATPLHLALRLKDVKLRDYVVQNLLEAGAETTIKDKNGDTALDFLQPGDVDLRRLMRKTQASNSVSKSDIVDDDDDEGSAGSGSESD